VIDITMVPDPEIDASTVEEFPDIPQYKDYKDVPGPGSVKQDSVKDNWNESKDRSGRQ
jgi:hypothetical protein